VGGKAMEIIMIKTRKTTRIASIVLTFVMLLSVICVAGTVSAGAATDKVGLYSSSVIFSKYGISNYEVFVQTKDNGSNQKVFIHYNYMVNGEWQDAQADYFTTLSDGSKIWRATFHSMSGVYAIKFVSGGREYWDNNNGRDYNGSDKIGVAPVVSERLGYQYFSYNSTSYRVNAVLQNYAYHKNVFVRYTTDGWNSYKDQAMTYTQSNANGTETWGTTLSINGMPAHGNFQYAICYKVNGREYWANNFGANYDEYYYIHR
jgi:hypothetical protein